MTLRILVVDDAAFVRDLVKRTLRTQISGVMLTEATDGAKAKALLAAQSCDLILCDWEMPGMSGLELLQWVRGNERTAAIPFVMITSRGDRGHVIEAVQKGVSDYLGKPFSPDMLMQKVRKALGRKLKGAGTGAGVGSSATTDTVSLLTGAPASPRSQPRSPAQVDSSSAALLAGNASLLSPDSGVSAAMEGSEVKTPGVDSASSGRIPSRAEKSKVQVAQVRFAEFSLPCLVRACTLNEIRLQTRSNQRFPAILEPAVVDIAVEEGQILERINGFVQMLQAQGSRADTDYVAITIRFVDEDPDKMASLSRYIEKLPRH